MPAYNAEKFIEASINSVLKQTYSRWELLIVNDGSTDSTKTIAEFYSAKDIRIKVFNQANKKQAGARNTAIENSHGSWIAFLDSDDVWEPNKLAKQIQASIDHPSAGVIYTDGWIFNDDDFNNLTPYPTITGMLIEPHDIYKMEYQCNYIPVLAVLVKRSIVDKIGLQDEGKTFAGCEDWDYWLRMARIGINFYGIPEKLFYYRRHDSNMSKNNLNMVLAQTSVFIKNFEGQYFSEKEAIRLFKKLIYPLTNNLIKNGRFEDIAFILNGVEAKLPTISFGAVKKVIKILGKMAYVPVAILGKIDLLILSPKS